ncbi:DUF4192 family protein [Agrococcus lahaulensis]|uniref:DUF4192 family protein n=1 Tax=Agrococcus lahaulensis TaxID=341722 RepID=UPI00047A65BF|nr:DUF4192 family protein [Agrococcus lahaulensis]
METVKIRTPQSLLRMLPRLVGPVEAPSLVALPFSRGRSGMPMALDLPDRRSAAPIAQAVRRGARGADAVVLVACLEQPLGARPLPHADELGRVARRLERSGMRVLELLALAPDAWGDYSSPAGARGPLAELELLDDPAPGVPEPPSLPGVPEGRGSAAALEVAAWLGELLDGDVAAARDDPIAALELAVSLADRLDVGPGVLGVDPAKAAALAIALVVSPAQRDLAIELAIDGTAAAERTLDAIEGDAATEAAANRFLGVGPAPDADRLRDRLRRWTAIAEATPLELRAPLLVIVGFLHFFLGRGRTAGRCAELAMAIDPTLTMAPLLRDIVDAKGAPDWVLGTGEEVGAHPATRE